MSELLHELLEASARRTPGAIAVVDQGAVITYQELDERANQLAHTLVSAGLRRGDRVGLYLDKSIDAVVGIYAILKAGCAYVPIDPDGPPSRLGLILADCGVSNVITVLRLRGKWLQLRHAGAPLSRLFVVDAPTPPLVDGLETIAAETIGRAPMHSLPRESICFDLAYILYTSGSTGSPKGVMLSHLNGLAFVRWAVNALGIQADDRLSSHAPLYFDLSILDVFAAASAGAAVVLVPAQTAAFPAMLARFIDTSGITVWYSVPSVLTMLATRGGLAIGDLPRLRTVLFAGEVFPVKHLQPLRELLPHARFCNLYGPTETNVCTWHDMAPLAQAGDGPQECGELPIGVAIDGVEVIAVAEDGREAVIGEVGELVVRGPTVMQGYWADAEKTANALVAHPVNAALPQPVYRTGDLVRRTENGTFWFIGRRDDQVKSRGYRIELGEVERAVISHPDVVECAVVAVADELVTNVLHAYVVGRDGLDVAELASHCFGRLPRYMVPSSFTFVDSMPRTSTGKTDRQALARQPVKVAAG